MFETAATEWIKHFNTEKMLIIIDKKLVQHEIYMHFVANGIYGSKDINSEIVNRH